MTGRDDHAKGFTITVIGILILSPDALLIRLTAIDDFSLAVSRGLLAGCVILAICMAWYRAAFTRRLLALGIWGLTISVLYGGSNIVFYAALERTSVANVLVIFAVSPLIAAIMARIFLRESISLATWLAILGAMSGILIVASGSLTSGHLLGDMLALVDAVSIAAVYTIVRWHRDVNMIPAAGIGMLICATMAFPFADLPPLVPTQWLWIGVGGGVVLPAAIMLLTLGPRYLPTPEVAMLTLLETVLGPAWVWLVIGEEAGTRTLIGGALVVATLFAHALWRFRHSPVTKPA